MRDTSFSYRFSHRSFIYLIHASYSADFQKDLNYQWLQLPPELKIFLGGIQSFLAKLLEILEMSDAEAVIMAITTSATVATILLSVWPVFAFLGVEFWHGTMVWV